MSDTSVENESRKEALKKLKVSSGPKFFVEYRAFIAEHTDTFAEGPITAKEWLDRLDKLEKENK